MANFAAFADKMSTAGLKSSAIQAFRRNYEALLRNETGLIAESGIEPVGDLPQTENFPEATSGIPELLRQAVVIKLNGGLGTSMGLTAPKSLLSVRKGLNFLDLMAQQILALRKQSGANVRLLLMNSFSTSSDTLSDLERYRDQGLADPNEVELMQNQIPKIDEITLLPIEWPADPELEWCPPGHGDLFPALVGSGWLDRLLEEGVNYAFVSNSDNLGAVMDPTLLSYFAESGAPFMMEVTRRTAADRKGGHLATRKTDGRLLLREVAQCPEDDLDAFQDIQRHCYFNTNNLWLRLDALRDQLQAEGGVLPLPMIKNRKTVDARDPDSPVVFQLEVAMGAAIECFDGSLAVEVPRSRFAPVKTTADLFALRSDAYVLSDNGQVRLHPDRDGVPPVIELDRHYKLVEDLEELGVPSLRHCDSLEVHGRIHFEDRVVIKGKVKIFNRSKELVSVPSGIYRDQTLELASE